MADLGNWRPAKGTHSIQMASVSITFAEPVNEKPWRRIEEIVTAAAATHGLTAKEPVRLVQMKIDGAPDSVPATSTDTAGFEILRRVRPDFFAEKIHVVRNAIIYEVWDYTRWAPMKAAAAALMRDAFEVFVESVQLSGVGATYNDLFQATEPGIEPDCANVIRSSSKYVAGRAFNRFKPWHSHIGWFDFPSPETRVLNQLNVDVGDGGTPDGVLRLAQVHSVVTSQFNQPGLPIFPAESQTWELVSSKFQTAHDHLKTLLKGVLTKEASQAISLK